MCCDGEAGTRFGRRKSGFSKYGAEGDRPPWQDEAVTSCVLQPTMSLMSSETVVKKTAA